MKIIYSWLQDYIEEKLPDPEKIAEVLTMHSFEVESIEKADGDCILDVDVLPNRAHDCLCHLGIAKEIAVLFDLKLKHQDLNLNLPESNELEVVVEDSKLCRRYIGVMIKGIKVGPSPKWLRERLEALEQKSINNIVDITNYVMFSLGQPMHAFDNSKLEVQDSELRIKVEKVNKDEEFLALDEEKYNLKAEMLAIKDGNSGKVLAVAGVKGGMEAGINEETTDIVLESANFDPSQVRRTSQDLKLQTDSSKRFENEISPELAMVGMKKAVRLIQESAGGEVEGIFDVYPSPQPQFKVGTSVSEVNKLLGTEMGESDVKDILEKLNFEYEVIDNPREKIVELAKQQIGKPYKLGASVSREAPNVFDCSSLTSWLYAQAGIQIPRISVDQYVWGREIIEEEAKPGDLIFVSVGQQEGPKVTEVAKTGEFPPKLNHCGIYLGDKKIIHSSRFNNGAKEQEIDHPDFKENYGFRKYDGVDEIRFVVTVPNDRLDLRPTPGELDVLGPQSALIEEIGRVYGYEHLQNKMPDSQESLIIEKNYYYQTRIREILSDLGFSEVITYAFQGVGEVEVLNPQAQDKKYLRKELKTGISKSLEFNEKHKDLLGLKDVNIFEIGKVFSENGEHNSLAIAGKQTNEAVKALNEELNLNLKANSEYFEKNLDELVEKLPELTEPLKQAGSKEIVFKPISSFPFVLRDIAVWLPEEAEADELKNVLIEKGGDLLIREPQLFDEYKKDRRVSYAFKLVFQSMKKTLSDEEVNAVMDKIYEVIKEKGWEVR